MAFVVLVVVVRFYLSDLLKSKNLFFLLHWKNESPLNMMKNERKLSSSGKTMNHKIKINQIYIKFNKKNWHFSLAKVFYNWTSKKNPNFLENVYSTCFFDSFFCLFVCFCFFLVVLFFLFFSYSVCEKNDKGWGRT